MADPSSLEGAIYTAAGALLVAVAGIVINQQLKRQSLRRMLHGEILAFAAVIESMELEKIFAALIQNPSKAGPNWREVSKENYFTLFEENAANLGLLDPTVVGHIAACYGFMKGSRDATRLLIDEPAISDEQRRWELRHVALLVGRSLKEARVAMECLEAADSKLAIGRQGVLSLDDLKQSVTRWFAMANVGQYQS